MNWNIRRKLFLSTIAFAVLLACVGFGVIPINLFFAKVTISEAAREQLGAELDIKGPLRLRLGFNPKLTASSVHFSISGSDGLHGAAIDQLVIRPRLLNLLKGKIDLPSLEARGVVLTGVSEAVPGFSPEKLSLTASAPLGEPLKIDITGLMNGESAKLDGSGASLTELLEASGPYTFVARISAFSSELNLDGSILNLFENPTLQALATFETDNASALLSMWGLDLPGFKTLTVQSGVRAGVDEVHVEGLRGETGDLSFTLSGHARNFSTRPWFEVDAALEQFDVSLLPDNNGATPGDEQQVLADLQPLYDGLAWFDGKATLRIGRLLNAPLEPENLAIGATLENGHLALNLTHLNLAGSEISAWATLDTGSPCAVLETGLRTSYLELQKFNIFLENGPEFGGSLEELRTTTNSCGASLDEHISSLRTHTIISKLNPQMSHENLPLEFNSLEALLNWNEPGEIGFDGMLSGENISAVIGIGSLDEIRSGAQSPLKISIISESFDAAVEGVVSVGDAGTFLDVETSVDVPRMGSLHWWLGTVPENDSPFRGRAGLRLDDDGVFISGFNAVLGDSDFSGTLGWPGPDSQLPVTATIKSSRIDLGEIADLFPDTPGPEQPAETEWSDFLDANEWIGRWFELPSIDFDFSVNAFDGLFLEAKNVRLSANIQNRLIENGKLFLQVEEIDIAGGLEADFRELPWSMEIDSTLENLDLGRLLSALDLAEDVDAQAKRVVLHFDSTGSSLRQMALNLHLESGIETLHWAFEAGPEQRRFDINLSDLDVNTSPESNTTWETTGTLNGSPVKAWMQTPSLPDTFDPTTGLPLKLVFGTGDDVLMLDMNIEHAPENVIRTDLLLSGAFMDPDSIDFPSLVSPLPDYELETRLTLTERDYLASDLRVRIGNSHVNGGIEIHREGPGYRFDLDFNSPFLETDDLVHWAEEFRNAHQVLAREKTADDVRQDVNAGLLELIDQYLDEFTGQNSVEIKAEVEELRSSGVLLGKTELGLQASDSEFTLDPMTIALPGGDIKAFYSSKKVEDHWLYSLHLDVEKLEYGGLLKLFEAESTATGEVFLDVDLSSHADDYYLLLNNLHGYADLALFPDNIEAKFLDLWASNLILALLPKTGNSGKQLNCMVARFEVENGVMNAKSAFLDSTEVIVRAKGEIDLANRQLDMLVAPQAKMEKFLSMSTPLAVKGPFDDFQVGVVPGGFVTTMFRWYYGLIYVPWKWITGERFPPDGIATCYKAMGWEIPAQ